MNRISSENMKSRRMNYAVEVCAELFLENGIESVKMTDIAEKSCIGVASLYRYFGTKTGMSIAVMTYLWNKLEDTFSRFFDSEYFRNQTGIKQVSELMRMFIVMYETHSDFMKLLCEFDSMIINENIPKEELKSYDSAVLNFYPIFERAFEKGISDGTIRRIDNKWLFYISFSHTLMELCKKLIRREFILDESTEFASKELETIINAAITYIRVDGSSGFTT